MHTKLKFLTFCAVTFWSLHSFAAIYPVTITTVAGRTITFNHQPQNIALSTSRIFPLLEIIYQQNAEQTFEEMNKQFGHRTISGDFGQNNIKAMQ